jgi:hypothetical protein
MYDRPTANAYMREWRKSHPLSVEQKKRDNARSYANVYKKRGIIAKQSCQRCGSNKAQMHHLNYELPKSVIWLCRPCHLAWHKYWQGYVSELFRDWAKHTVT